MAGWNVTVRGATRASLHSDIEPLSLALARTTGAALGATARLAAVHHDRVAARGPHHNLRVPAINQTTSMAEKLGTGRASDLMETSLENIGAVVDSEELDIETVISSEMEEVSDLEGLLSLSAELETSELAPTKRNCSQLVKMLASQRMRPNRL